MSDVLLKNESGETVTYPGVSGVNLMTTDGPVTFTEANCIYAQGAVPYGKELNYTWAELHEMLQDGDTSAINIGDYKTIERTTGDIAICEVAGIDQYYGMYAVDQHHIDFISRDLVSGTWLVYNDYDDEGNISNNGTSSKRNPFMASKLYQSLNNTTDGIITTLPQDLRNIIINKSAVMEQRYSASDAFLTQNSGQGWVEMGPLWLPTEFEIWGHTTWSDPKTGIGYYGANIQYPIFKGGLKHIIKNMDGEPDSWWTASAYAGSSNSFCLVDYYGRASCGDADGGCGVPLCFRIA